MICFYCILCYFVLKRREPLNQIRKRKKATNNKTQTGFLTIQLLAICREDRHAGMHAQTSTSLPLHRCVFIYFVILMLSGAWYMSHVTVF